MRPANKFQVLQLVWLAVIALLAGSLGAAEQVPASERVAAERGVGKHGASDPAKLDVRLSELEQRLFDRIDDGRFGEFRCWRRD